MIRVGANSSQKAHDVRAFFDKTSVRVGAKDVLREVPDAKEAGEVLQAATTNPHSLPSLEENPKPFVTEPSSNSPNAPTAALQPQPMKQPDSSHLRKPFSHGPFRSDD